MPFIDFAALKAAVSIEQAVETLGLVTKQEGSQLRTACPACKSGGDRAIVLTPAKGLFYCFAAKKGGDCIGLAAHVMGVGNNDAANFLADQLGTGTDTVPDKDTSTVSKTRATAPQKPREEAPSPSAAASVRPKTASASFDPGAYLAKLTYSDEVAALGISEAEAQALGIGWSNSGMHKGIAFALRWETGEIAGFCSVIGGEVKLPKRLIPPTIHVLKRPA